MSLAQEMKGFLYGLQVGSDLQTARVNRQATREKFRQPKDSELQPGPFESGGGGGGDIGTTNAPRTAQVPGGNTRYRDAIASIESAGVKDPYRAKGRVVNRQGDRALGRYQIMASNVGPWSQQVLGQALTTDQFLASNEAQDKIFDAIFGGYVQKYGERGAAQAWFAGPGNVGKDSPADINGMTNKAYGDRFMQALQGQPGEVEVAQQPAIPSEEEATTTAEAAPAEEEGQLPYEPPEITVPDVVESEIDPAFVENEEPVVTLARGGAIPDATEYYQEGGMPDPYNPARAYTQPIPQQTPASGPAPRINLTGGGGQGNVPAWRSWGSGSPSQLKLREARAAVPAPAPAAPAPAPVKTPVKTRAGTTQYGRGGQDYDAMWRKAMMRGDTQHAMEIQGYMDKRKQWARQTGSGDGGDSGYGGGPGTRTVGGGLYEEGGAVTENYARGGAIPDDDERPGALKRFVRGGQKPNVREFKRKAGTLKDDVPQTKTSKKVKKRGKPAGRDQKKRKPRGDTSKTPKEVAVPPSRPDEKEPPLTRLEALTGGRKKPAQVPGSRFPDEMTPPSGRPAPASEAEPPLTRLEAYTGGRKKPAAAPAPGSRFPDTMTPPSGRPAPAAAPAAVPSRRDMLSGQLEPTAAPVQVSRFRDEMQVPGSPRPTVSVPRPAVSVEPAPSRRDMLSGNPEPAAAPARVPQVTTDAARQRLAPARKPAATGGRPHASERAEPVRAGSSGAPGPATEQGGYLDWMRAGAQIASEVLAGARPPRPAGAPAAAPAPAANRMVDPNSEWLARDEQYKRQQMEGATAPPGAADETPWLAYAQGGAIPDEDYFPPKPVAEGAAYPASSAETPAGEQRTQAEPPQSSVNARQVLQSARMGVLAGLEGLKREFGVGGQQGAVPTPEMEMQQQEGIRRFARHEGAARPEELAVIDQRMGVDQIQADPGIKNMIRIDRVMQWHLLRGDKERAEAVAASMLLWGAQQVSRAGAVAAAALDAWQQSGDPKDFRNASLAVQKAHQMIPDGLNMKIDLDPKTRQIVATIVNDEGKVSKQVVDPAAIPGLLQSAMNGSAYWKAVFQVGHPNLAEGDMRSQRSAESKAADRAYTEDWEQRRHERDQGELLAKEERAAREKLAARQLDVEEGRTAGERMSIEEENWFADWGERLGAATTPEDRQALITEGLSHRYQNARDRNEPVLDSDLALAVQENQTIAEEDRPTLLNLARMLAIKNDYLDGSGAAAAASALITDPVTNTPQGTLGTPGFPDLIFNPTLLPQLRTLREKYKQ